MALGPGCAKHYEVGHALARAQERILEDWENRARDQVEAARAQSEVALRDSMPEFLGQLVRTLLCADPDEQSKKNSEVAREHGEDRADQADYTLDEVIFEYHLLRAVVAEALDAELARDPPARRVVHEFIDRGIRKSAVEYAERETRREATAKVEKERMQAVAAQALEASVQDLRKERELRERFVDALTHDLRTPLTAARLSTQLLRQKAHESGTVERLAARVIANLDRSEAMVRDLLDANRIKAGGGIPVAPADCRLDLVLEAAAAELRALYGPRFELRNEAGDCPGRWDAEALQRVVENLASNAVKYGDPRQPITIGLRRDGDHALLWVHNHGQPIAPADQADLFESYRRTSSAVSSGQKGWGIGLTLVRGIALAHRGSAWLESDAERGTTFFVRLPLKPPRG